jgi:hypothetical protein
MPEVHQQLCLAGDRGGDPRAQREGASGRHAAVAPPDPLEAQGGIGRREPGVATAIHGSRPRVRCLAAEAEAVALDSGAAVHCG